MSRFRLREHAPGVLVAALSSAFGVAILAANRVLSTLIEADDLTGSSDFVAVALDIVGAVFIAIALYVGAVVSSNTFATIVAGRTRTIALARLLGSAASRERAAVAREGLLVGLAGALIGAGAGFGAAWLGVQFGLGLGFLPDLGFEVVSPVLALPVAAVVVTTWLASWVGASRVLTVTPLQAMGNAVERSYEGAAVRRGRNIAALVIAILGGVILALGMLLGLVSPLGLLVGVLGGMISFTGVVLGADRIMPLALRLVGRMLGSSPAARLASENALRYPERSSRSTIGLVIGVTLVTTLAITVTTFRAMVLHAAELQPDEFEGIDEILSVVVAVFTVLMGFSALIAAVGMVNSVSLSVLQRTRELALLRALGFSRLQVRRMIIAESAQLSVAGILVGVALGVVYGWAGAQSLLGMYVFGFVAPVVPWELVAALIGVTVVLTFVASVAPSRRATRLSPVDALAIQ